MEQVPLTWLESTSEAEPTTASDVALEPEVIATVIELMGRALLAVRAAQTEEAGDDR